MRPLNQLQRFPIRGVLTDVDETLTQSGRLTASTYRALEALRLAGIHVIPVTGRSAGWGHLMMTQWPVDAVIVESGGASFIRRSDDSIALQLTDAESASLRPELLELCRQWLEFAQPLQFALDNQFRVADVAIDFNEAIRAPAALVSRFVAQLQQHGYCARTSSIHINTWTGQFDKGPTALALINQLFPDIPHEHWACIGDAPNDQSLFEHFELSVGVANIQPALQHMSAKPRYLTEASFGKGFEEFAAHIIDRQS
jgi:HAD superfamily hydrolase (TIGR01484 family)